MTSLSDTLGADAASPHWERAALVTIDMQNDFVRRDGASAIPGTDSILPALVTLVEGFRAARRPVFHAVRLYHPDGSNAERCRRDAIQAGRAIVSPGSHGAHLVTELCDADAADHSALLSGRLVPIGDSEWLLYKPRWSAFFRTALTARLSALGVDTVVVAGCNFPNCPSATLFDASARDFRMVLASDAVSQLTPAGLDWCRGIGVGTYHAAAIASLVHSAAPADAQESALTRQ